MEFKDIHGVVADMARRLDALEARMDAWIDSNDTAKERLLAENRRLAGEAPQQRQDQIKERLDALETVAAKYEELRSIIDDGSESMTHQDAVDELIAMRKNQTPQQEARRRLWLTHYHSICEGDLVRVFFDEDKAKDYCRAHKINFLTQVSEVLPTDREVWMRPTPGPIAGNDYYVECDSDEKGAVRFWREGE